MSQTNSEHQVNLKNPFLAALLGYLIPGAGHLYQGRYFKGAIFFLCIAGTFCYGMQMAEGKAVYFKKEINKDAGFQNWGFLAQAGVGTPAIAAVVQWKRFNAESNKKERQLVTSLNEPFTGKLILIPEDGERQVKGILKGTVSLKPAANQRGRVEGTFKGTLDGKNITLQLRGSVELQIPVTGNPQRSFACAVAQGEAEAEQGKMGIEGAIPRAFYNSFAAPLENGDLQDVRRRLGNKYDLAVIFTWIAGLLNVLAVWDAFEGPAYGYDDKSLQKDDKRENEKPASAEPSTPSVPAESAVTTEQAP